MGHAAGAASAEDDGDSGPVLGAKAAESALGSTLGMTSPFRFWANALTATSVARTAMRMRFIG